MKIKGLIWFDDIVEKLTRKHNVQQNEVREILHNKPLFRFVEKGHRSGENVYAAMGQTDSNRYLIVFFVYKNDKRALILSARGMTKVERSLYEKT
ncbi:MAG: BrnT family toxin [Deltaproteobacteria bacterium]|nr:BrnT family toxin [Deltaproteobacteria bacterium]